MNRPRIEPRIDPVTPAPDLRAPRRAAPPAESPPPRRRARWLAWLLLGLVAAPPALILLLRWLPPPTTAFMLQSEVRPVQQQWVPWAYITPSAGLAVVAAEDQKFPMHHGFDLEAIGEALEENRERSRPRGASTISQQTAKNLFLWPGGGYFRKGIEAGLTVLIEALWPKRRILEVYLNVAEFGPGIYGVEAAAQHYFNTTAARLSPQQCALLAAVLPNPSRLHPAPASDYVQERANWIRGQMAQLGSGYLAALN